MTALKLEISQKKQEILKRIRILPKYNINHLIGNKRTSDKGRNEEFNEHKLFSQGDEKKYIDWKVLARTEQFYVKTFHQQKSSNRFILIDVSPSMAYQNGITNQKNNFVYLSSNSSRLNSAIWYSFYLSTYFYLHREPLGMMTFTNKIHLDIPLSSVAQHYRKIFNTLSALKQEDSITDYLQITEQCINKIPIKSQVFFLSDFYTPIDVINLLLKTFYYKKIDFHLVHLFDEQEANDLLNTKTYNKFIDIETKNTSNSNYLIIQQYNKILKKHSQGLKELCVKNRAHYHSISIRKDVFKQFYSFFQY